MTAKVNQRLARVAQCVTLIASVVLPRVSLACNLAPGEMFAYPLDNAEVPRNYAVFVLSERGTINESYARSVDGVDLEVAMRFGSNDATEVLKIFEAPTATTAYTTSATNDRIIRVNRSTEDDTTPPDPPPRPSLTLLRADIVDECVGSEASGEVQLTSDAAAFVLEVNGMYGTSGLATNRSVRVGVPETRACITVRAIDLAGNMSQPSPPQCFDDRDSGCMALGSASSRTGGSVWPLLLVLSCLMARSEIRKRIL